MAPELDIPGDCEVCDGWHPEGECPGEEVALRVCNCGLPMSRNPHPDAGNPTRSGLTIGHLWVCIPCTVKSRHGWATRALRCERAIAELRDAIGGNRAGASDEDQRLDHYLAPLWNALSGSQDGP